MFAPYEPSDPPVQQMSISEALDALAGAVGPIYFNARESLRYLNSPDEHLYAKALMDRAGIPTDQVDCFDRCICAMERMVQMAESSGLMKDMQWVEC